LKISCKRDNIQLKEGTKLDTYERFLTGTMDSDGLITPFNEPKLWKRLVVKIATTTGNNITVATIASLFPDVDMNDMTIKFWMLMDTTNDAAGTDQALLNVTGTGFVIPISISNANAGDMVDGGVIQPCTIPLSQDVTSLVVDFASWAGGETHNGLCVIEFWHTPADTSVYSIATT